MQQPTTTTTASWKHVSAAPSSRRPSEQRAMCSAICSTPRSPVLVITIFPLGLLPFPSSVRRDAQISRLPSFLPSLLAPPFLALLTSIPVVDLRTSVWRRRRRRWRMIWVAIQ